MALANLETVLRWLSPLNERVTGFSLWISACMLGLMAVLVATQVFFRYVLNNSLTWAEDLSLMMLVISAFLVMPYAYRRSLHISIDLFTSMLAPRMRSLFFLVSGTIILALSIFFVDVSWEFAARSTINANALPIKMKYIYAILPISFIMLIPTIVELQLRSLIGLFDPSNEFSRLPQVEKSV